MIAELLRLKRYEQPSSEYFEDFLREFQARRREELVERSSFALGFERFGAWLGELGRVRWAYAVGLSYAAVLLGLFLWPHGEERAGLPAAPVGHEQPLVAPADLQQDMDLQGTAADELPEREF